MTTPVHANRKRSVVFGVIRRSTKRYRPYAMTDPFGFLIFVCVALYFQLDNFAVEHSL